MEEGVFSKLFEKKIQENRPTGDLENVKLSIEKLALIIY